MNTKMKICTTVLSSWSKYNLYKYIAVWWFCCAKLQCWNTIIHKHEKDFIHILIIWPSFMLCNYFNFHFVCKFKSIKFMYRTNWASLQQGLFVRNKLMFSVKFCAANYKDEQMSISREWIRFISINHSEGCAKKSSQLARIVM